MDGTILLKRTRNDPFARVPKEILDDEKLSWKAKGILSYLLSKKDGWKARTTDLVNHGTDGRDAVRSGLSELIEAGYAMWQTLRGGDGLLMGKVLIISDTRETLTEGREIRTESRKIPLSENPTVGKDNTNKNDRETRIIGIKSEAPDQLALTADFGPEKNPHTEFIEGYCKLYEQHFGGKYLFSGAKDSAAAKRLLKSGVPIAEALRVVGDAFTRTGYPWDSATTIASLVSNWARLLAAGKKQAKPSRHILVRQIEALESEIAQHPANHEYVGALKNPTQAQYDQLDGMKKQLREIKRQLYT